MLLTGHCWKRAMATTAAPPLFDRELSLQLDKSWQYYVAAVKYYFAHTGNISPKINVLINVLISSRLSKCTPFYAC